MVKCHIVIKDRKNKVLLEKVFDSKNPHVAAEKFSKMYPDGWINMKQVEGEGKFYVALTPENMKKDQIRLDNGEITINSFISKWYPGKKATKKDVKSQITSDYDTEDVVEEFNIGNYEN